MALRILPLPAPQYTATATARDPKAGELQLPALAHTPPVPHESTAQLVPLETSLGFKMGQSGVYCTFEVSVRCVDLHPAGDMAARSACFAQQVAWTLTALDSHAGAFNKARKALGMTGAWDPSGTNTPDQPASTLDMAPPPSFKKFGVLP